MIKSPTPTADEMETAMSVLLWLHESTRLGADCDDISHVRHLLDEAIDEAEGV